MQISAIPFYSTHILDFPEINLDLIRIYIEQRQIEIGKIEIGIQGRLIRTNYYFPECQKMF